MKMKINMVCYANFLNQRNTAVSSMHFRGRFLPATHPFFLMVPATHLLQYVFKINDILNLLYFYPHHFNYPDRSIRFPHFSMLSFHKILDNKWFEKCLFFFSSILNSWEDAANSVTRPVYLAFWQGGMAWLATAHKSEGSFLFLKPEGRVGPDFLKAHQLPSLLGTITFFKFHPMTLNLTA